jgi:branched-chain amino acid transport system substrate-binding protein
MKYGKLGLALAMGVLYSSSALADETVTVGLVGVMTGPNAQNGEYCRNGAMLAINEINAAGGIALANGTKAKLALEVVDDQGKPDVGLNAIRKLVSDENVVGFMGPDYSGVTVPTLFVGEEAGVSQITSSIAAKISESGDEHIFVGRSNDAQWMRALVDYSVTERKFKTVGVSFTNIELGRSGKDVALAYLKDKYGINASVEVSHGFGDKDLTASAAQIVQANPELLINWGTQIEAALLLRKLRSLGWQGVFAYNAADDIFANLAQDQVKGVIGPQNWIWTKDDAKTKTFVEAYEKAYGNRPSPHAIVYYDGVRLLAEAAQKGGDDRSAILKQMKAISKWDGVQGTYNPSVKTGSMINAVVIIEYDDKMIPKAVKTFD